jgi:hypothetical protein
MDTDTNGIRTVAPVHGNCRDSDRRAVSVSDILGLSTTDILSAGGTCRVIMSL